MDQSTISFPLWVNTLVIRITTDRQITIAFI